MQAGELAQALDRLVEMGYNGVNVTVPLKEEAFEWCLTACEVSLACRAVNTVGLSARAGTTTDAPAFVKVAKGLGFGAGSKVLVLGAGGTARTAIVAFAAAGLEVSAWNRTAAKLAGLADKCAVLEAPDPAGQDLVVNCTSAGHLGEAVPLLWERAGGATVLDANYGPAHEPLRQAAARVGVPVFDGLAMLVEQAALSFEWWTQQEAPREAMMKALDERVEPDP